MVEIRGATWVTELMLLVRVNTWSPRFGFNGDTSVIVERIDRLPYIWGSIIGNLLLEENKHLRDVIKFVNNKANSSRSVCEAETVRMHAASLDSRREREQKNITHQWNLRHTQTVHVTIASVIMWIDLSTTESNKILWFLRSLYEPPVRDSDEQGVYRADKRAIRWLDWYWIKSLTNHLYAGYMSLPYVHCAAFCNIGLNAAHIHVRKPVQLIWTVGFTDWLTHRN